MWTAKRCLSVHQRILFALGIGMIHQHFKLVDVLTAAENIILGLEGKSVLDMKKVVQDIQEVTERYGFELDPNQKIYDMSVSPEADRRDCKKCFTVVQIF